MFAVSDPCSLYSFFSVIYLTVTLKSDLLIHVHYSIRLFSTVQGEQLKTLPQMYSEVIFLTLTHIRCNVTCHLLEIMLAVTSSVLRYA